MPRLLDGKVAVVTGAGGGLGRSHALALAAEGAKVVVNDPGVSRDGGGGGQKTADAVVEEIREAGGEAVANHDSVATTEGAEAIVRTALEKFGRIDILVNNAGILRDKTILKMDDAMWDTVVAVHLRGSWACTRAAARAMKEKGSGGRIINTTSIAGLKGSFGQSNYASAKAGIYGLTRVTSIELAKEGITVNAIAPLAKTRMTEDIGEIPAEFKPEDVSPVVVFLASDLAKDVTGRIFGVHGRHLFEYRMEMTPGKEKKEPWTVSEISECVHASEAVEAKPAAPSAGGSKIGLFFKALPLGFDAEKAAGWESVMHFEIPGAGDWAVEVKGGKVRVADGKPAAPTCVITIEAETLLGMIAGTVKADMAFMQGKIKATKLPDLGKFGKVFDFRKLQGAPAVAAPKPAEPQKGLNRALVGRRYLGSALLVPPRRLATYDEVVGDAGSPVFPVCLVRDLFLKLLRDPEFNGDLARMVHGEQAFVFHRPIRGGDLLSPRGQVLSIEDKSSGQVLSFGQKLWCEGELLVEMESRLFFRGEARGAPGPRPEPPARGAPSSTASVVAAADLPKRYAAASGDDNPIHLDEGLAKAVGFRGVILHGLCTLAIAARALPKNLARLQVRFSKPAYPGDTLTTSVWKTGDRLEFETATQNGDRVLTEGVAGVRG